MNKSEALKELKEALKEEPELLKLSHENPKRNMWVYRVDDTLREGFGPNSNEFKRFTEGVPRDELKGSDRQLQKWLDSRLKRRATVIQSIIEKHERQEEEGKHAESGGNKKAELEQFRDGLLRYRALILAKKKAGQSWSLEAKLQKLQTQLQQKRGGIESALEEHGGSLSDYRYEFGERVKYDIFDSALGSTSFKPYPAQFIINALDAAINEVNKAIGRLEPPAATQLPHEAVYPSGKPYDAYKDIKGIIIGVSKKLIVVDPYVDSTPFSLLENVKTGIQIQILTRQIRGDFEVTGQKFRAQQGMLEVRKSGKLHDRFIVADEKIFHIGASIKDAGTKMCAMSEFEGAYIKKTLRKTISSYWDEAEIVL